MTSPNPETDRTVLRVTGADAGDFLQNLVTNDVGRLDRGPVYAALLTPQGKLIADFIMVAEGDAILIDVATIWAKGLLQRLTMYRLRAAVQIDETDLQVRRGTGEAPEGAVADPRHPALGWRLYGAEGGDDGTDWDAVRVQAGVPASGIELGPESYILEVGFERLNGVDFRKGCYVGQEIAARMKHKTELRKGLRVMGLDGTAPVGTEILRDGKPVGTLFTQSGDKALAYVRFDRLGDGMVAGSAKVIDRG
ncbi:YgfZ/GcvT domain-containing protein [Pseudooceanicola onchidii]|uniref:CAF17-like 4Fe-4S cluster assembly/insertion protein YgfZ n=1 Tax=Pseudooceanicola onchidii TaxID=2562279 RepID=UPI0010AA1345|nr:folate-binding protein YgfZ [Pseudooceanicola onchidii]